MKRFSIIIFIVTITAFGLFAQEIGDPDAQRLGIMDAQMSLREISVDKFEHEGFWRVHKSSDEGIATARLFEGGPAAKVPIAEEEGLGIQDDYVLGVKIEFYRRGINSFVVYPQRPLPVEGISKTVSVWVVGRNFNHNLFLLLEDAFGRQFELYMGRLNFQGWRRLTVAIPPQAPDGLRGIVQRNYHHPHMMGIRITGFRVVCDLMQAYGTYYIYFDDLRVVTDLFAEELRDPDDMSDFW